MQAVSETHQLREDVLNATRALVGIAARSLSTIGDDVTLAQYRVLVLLDGRGPLTMGALAQSLGVTPSTVTRVCSVLVEKKLISRETSLANRRLVRASLTGGGRNLVARVMEDRRVLIESALAQMTPNARRRFAAGLRAFAVAAGEVSDEAWMLGWSLSDEDRAHVRA